MSRERPTKLPEHRHFEAASKLIQKHDELALRRHEERERLKNFSGPGFFGGLMNLMTTGAKAAPQFIRRGYEADILDELRDFFTRRPRPWRPATRAPKINRKTLPRVVGRRVMLCRQAENRALGLKRWRYVTDAREAKAAQFVAGRTMGGSHA